MREGTESFTLKPSAWKGYPKGVRKPTGPFRLAPTSEVASLRSEFKRVRAQFRKAWQLQNPGKIWNNDWRVHHVKPLKFGGKNEYSNFEILDKNLHDKLTRFWGVLMNLLAKGGSLP